MAVGTFERLKKYRTSPLSLRLPIPLPQPPHQLLHLIPPLLQPENGSGVFVKDSRPPDPFSGPGLQATLSGLQDQAADPRGI